MRSTRYVRSGESATPRISRNKDGTLRLSAGGGAYSFSFHTGYFTTGKDLPVVNKSVRFPGWSVTVTRVVDKGPDRGNITALKVRLDRPPRAVLYWDGARIRRLP